MYLKQHKGSTENIYGYDCQLPEVGYGVNVVSGELEYVGVYSASNKKDEQIWKRIGLPKDWDKKEKSEAQLRLKDKDYFDTELEKFRDDQWRYRLCGYWLLINGKHIYITGLHWFYLTWVQIDIGFPHYRDNDRKSFYVWRHCEEDPYCAIGFGPLAPNPGGTSGIFVLRSIGTQRQSTH